jgi:hypothetical protein
MKLNKFRSLVLFIAIALVSCSPQQADGSLIQTAIAQTEQAKASISTPVPAPIEKPTEKPTQVPTKEPTSTIVVEEPEPSATPEEVSTQTPEVSINERFVPIYPDNTAFIDSDTADNSWTEMMDSLARNQAIPKPFEWQLAELPDSTRWDDVYTYFNKFLVAKGWTSTADGGEWVTLAQGNTMYVGGFKKDSDGKKEKISLLFYPVSKSYKSHYFAFYSLRK